MNMGHRHDGGPQTARFGAIEVEQLWNRGGATGGKGSALRRDENGLIQPRTVATGCHPLPFGSHGKEGVSGSSPERALSFYPAQTFSEARNAGEAAAGYSALIGALVLAVCSRITRAMVSQSARVTP